MKKGSSRKWYQGRNRSRFMAKDKKTYSNIFDAVSDMEQQKPSNQAKEAGNIEDSLDRYKKLHDFIKRTVEQSLNQKQLTQKMLQDFFDAPSNFTEEQWKLIQDQKDEVEHRLQELVPPRKEAGTKQEEEKSKKEYKPKAMQVKSRWIPMR